MFIPKGSVVVMPFYGLHGDNGTFGSDIESLRPERWETARSEQWELMGSGGGSRICLGRLKATIEASYALARLARAITKLESRDSRDWKGEMKITVRVRTVVKRLSRSLSIENMWLFTWPSEERLSNRGMSSIRWLLSSTKCMERSTSILVRARMK
jgi:hypothetical protein